MKLKNRNKSGYFGYSTKEFQALKLIDLVVFDVVD